MDVLRISEVKAVSAKGVGGVLTVTGILSSWVCRSSYVSSLFSFLEKTET